MDILPAIIPKGDMHLKEELSRLRFLAHIQIDIVDGVFIAPASWPYEPAGDPKEIQNALPPFSIEVDCMVRDQPTAIAAWESVGVQRFILHIEAWKRGDDLTKYIDELRNTRGHTIGIALQNDTTLDALTPHIKYVDFVQCMGIAKIGVQGQPFDERVLERIKKLKVDHPELPIQIDGSVNAKTLPRLLKAGADRFAVGSALTAAPDPRATYEKLTALIS